MCCDIRVLCRCKKLNYFWIKSHKTKQIKLRRVLFFSQLNVRCFRTSDAAKPTSPSRLDHNSGQMSTITFAHPSQNTHDSQPPSPSPFPQNSPLSLPTTTIQAHAFLSHLLALQLFCFATSAISLCFYERYPHDVLFPLTRGHSPSRFQAQLLTSLWCRMQTL